MVAAEQHRLEDSEKSEADAARSSAIENLAAADPRPDIAPGRTAEREPAAQKENAGARIGVGFYQPNTHRHLIRNGNDQTHDDAERTVGGIGKTAEDGGN